MNRLLYLFEHILLLGTEEDEEYGMIGTPRRGQGLEKRSKLPTRMRPTITESSYLKANLKLLYKKHTKTPIHRNYVRFIICNGKALKVKTFYTFSGKIVLPLKRFVIIVSNVITIQPNLLQ